MTLTTTLRLALCATAVLGAACGASAQEIEQAREEGRAGGYSAGYSAGYDEGLAIGEASRQRTESQELSAARDRWDRERVACGMRPEVRIGDPDWQRQRQNRSLAITRCLVLLGDRP